MPEEGFLDAKVAAIRQEFAFADSVMSTVDVISDFFDTVAEGKPAKIEIHLENARSIYDYGGTAYALDMTWYAEYKPTVDTILSSIMWIFFTWRVFVHLPNIINGIAGTPGDFGKGPAFKEVGMETKRIEMKR